MKINLLPYKTIYQMKKFAYLLITIFLFFVSINLVQQPIFASISNDSEYSIKIPITPIPCGGSGCPQGMRDRYNNLFERYKELQLPLEEETCADDYSDFLTNPMIKHYFVEDPEITVQGKANERARQFISWVINRNAIDDHPVLKEIWGISRNVAFFLVLLVAAILGLGIIISRKTNFQTSIQVWPALKKIALSLLYIAFSASIVLLLIQISEIMMKFFIENLGGRDLFNIYFSDNSREKNYLGWIGCRDLNIRVQESIQSERFLLNLTNITYYVMGTMLLLRKILLWFLLFVSPFLAILMPFVLIKNIGWIWIGVFFQWLFYGPLFALFLGALSKIWRSGIPFTFDFSRVDQAVGYIFPSGLNLTYGGPAQFLTLGNNGNYIDTFIEYVISLIMLWAVIFFPWWLLRIFRDYCCDGIYAMKNILMSMYDQTHAGPNPSPPSITPKQPSTFSTGISMKIPQDTPVRSSIKLETIEEIRKTRTEDISKSLNLTTTKLTDIARFETNKQTNETVRRNLDYLANPTHAGTPNERQKYMNIRTELFSRAIKEDQVAKQILTSISSSRIEQINRRQDFFKSASVSAPAATVISSITNLPVATVTSVSSSLIKSVINNSQIVKNVAQTTNLPTTQIQTILQSYQHNISQPVDQVVNNITQTTGVNKNKVIEVIKQTNSILKSATFDNLIKQIATSEKTKEVDVETIIDKQSDLVTQTTPLSPPVTQMVAQKTKLAEHKINAINSSFINNITNDQNYVSQLSQSIQLPTQKIQAVLTSYTQQIGQSPMDVIKNITRETGLERGKVIQVLKQVVEIFKPEINMVQQVSVLTQVEPNQVQTIVSTYQEKTKLSESTLQTISQDNMIEKDIVKQIMQQYSIIINQTDEQKINTVAQSNNLTTTQVQMVVNNKQIPMVKTEEQIIQEIAKETGIVKEKVEKVVKQTTTLTQTKNLSKQSVKEVAVKEDVTEEDVEMIMKNSIPVVVEPEKYIEQTVTIPPSISLEDYEEVKKMWISQYEKGEVPTTEDISTREEWVNKDVVFVTNTLNKLLSPNEELKQQGLDDLGYILPIFLINNLKGEELIVYLKAKVEAAKQVAEQIDREKQIVLKLQKKDEEELVEVDRPKTKAAAKTITLQDSMELPEEKEEKEQKKEDIAKDDHAQTSDKQTSSQTPPIPNPTTNEEPKKTS